MPFSFSPYSRDVFESSHKMLPTRGYTPVSSSSGSGNSRLFTETSLSLDQIASNLRDELKRLRRRRQIAISFTDDTSAHVSPGSAPGSPEPMLDDAVALKLATSNSLTSSVMLPRTAENKPLFSLRQMTLICERMCRVSAPSRCQQTL